MSENQIGLSWVNMRRLEKLFEDEPKKVNLVLSRAVNRATATVKSSISTAVRKQYVISAADVKSSIDITKATANKPVAIVRSAGNKIDLTKFRVSPASLSNGQHNYSVQVKKDGGRKLVPGFAAKAPSWGLFRRTGAARFPITRLMGPSVPEMIGQPDAIAYISDKGSDMLNRRVVHELERMEGK